MFQCTGEYVKHHSKRKNGTDYYTFTPAPLIDGVSIDVDEELLALLTAAHRLLGTLEGMVVYLPNRDIIKIFMSLNEACYSRLIDRNDTLNFYDTLKKVSTKQDSISTITNIVTASEYAYGKPIGKPQLSKIYSIILECPGTDKRVKVRSKQIFMYNVVTNLKIYSPTAPEHILPALTDISKFLMSENNTDVFIKATLAHYQFEMIHPYECCNGLIGRIMLQMVLFDQYKSAPYLCLSEYLYRNKNEYFDVLSSTQMSGGYLHLIKFFLHCICYSANRAVEQIKRFEEIVASDEKRIIDLNPSSKFVYMTYKYFRNSLISEIMPVSEQLGCSYNTAAKAIGILVDLDILKVANEQERHRVYIYDSLLNIF